MAILFIQPVTYEEKDQYSIFNRQQDNAATSPFMKITPQNNSN